MNCTYQDLNFTYKKLSGWGPNQFGNYNGCLGKGYQYVVQLISDNPLKMMGICLPTECPIEQYINPHTYYPDKQFLFYFTIVLISLGIFLSICIPIYILISKKEKIQSTVPTTTISVQKSRLSFIIFIDICVQSFYLNNSFNYARIMILRHKQLLITPRVIACLLTIYGFVFYMLSVQAPNQVNYIFIGRSLYAGDLFLFLSGFMLSIQVLSKKYSSFLDQASSLLWYFVHILLRLIRIYPLYIMTFLFFTQIIPHIGFGPRWPGEVIQSECSFIYNALLMGNIFDTNITCQLQTWYICADFQIFLFGLLLLRVYAKKQTKSLLWICLLVFFVINLVISLSFHFRLAVIMEKNQFNEYIKPWARAPIYIFGQLMGIAHTEYKHNGQGNIFSYYKQMQFEYKVYAQFTAYGLGVLIIILTLFIPDIQPNSWPIGLQSIWWSMSPYVLVFGVMLLLLPVIVGDINLHLIVKIGAFLSFGTSMCALGLVQGFGYGFYQSYYFQEIMGVLLFIYMVVICSVFGFVISLMIEMPYMQIRTYLERYWTQKYKDEQLL